VSSRDPYCPHCDAYVGRIVADESQFPPMEISANTSTDHDVVMTCNQCGKDFGLTRSILLTVTYETKKETTR